MSTSRVCGIAVAVTTVVVGLRVARAQPFDTIEVYDEYPPEYEALGLENQNSADVAGDLYFVTRQFGLPVECSDKPDDFQCDNPEADNDRNVVSRRTVEVEHAYGLYAECNIKNASQTYACDCLLNKTKRVPCNATEVGHADVATRYPPPLPGADAYDWWHVNLAYKFGGNWYSTLKRGDCDLLAARRHSPAASDVLGSCGWRLVETTRTVASSCIKARISAVVEAYDAQAFEACPLLADGSGAYNQSTACYSYAFLGIVLGPNGTSDVVGPEDGIPNALLLDAWALAFNETDEALGGCPEVPVDVVVEKDAH